MADNLIMPFGKYRDQNIEAVPASYLLWCIDEPFISRYARVENYIKKNLKELKKDAEIEARAHARSASYYDYY